MGVPISGGGCTIYIVGWPGRPAGSAASPRRQPQAPFCVSLTRRHMTRGFAPALRGTFVSAKVPKAILPRDLRPSTAFVPGNLRLRLPQGVRRRHFRVPTTNAGIHARLPAGPNFVCPCLRLDRRGEKGNPPPHLWGGPGRGGSPFALSSFFLYFRFPYICRNNHRMSTYMSDMSMPST